MRMDYQTFKQAFADEFRDYLPKKYDSWTGQIDRVPKVNGYAEAYHVVKPEQPCACPTLYLNDLYKDYLYCGSIEQVCLRAAEQFVRGMDYIDRVSPYTMLESPMENVVFQLVNAEMNTELLEDVPHRQMLDLAVIYRLVTKGPGEGFHSAIITHELAEEIGSPSEEELYRAAFVNTPRHFPLCIDDFGAGMKAVTNETRTLGASAVLYPSILNELADDAERNIILLPSSVHEFFVVPDVFVAPEELKDIIRSGNAAFCHREDILSENVYRYNRETKKIEIVG